MKKLHMGKPAQLAKRWCAQQIPIPFVPIYGFFCRGLCLCGVCSHALHRSMGIFSPPDHWACYECRVKGGAWFCLFLPRILTASAVRRIRRLDCTLWWALVFDEDLQRSGSRQSAFLLVIHTARSTQLAWSQYTKKCSLHRLGWLLTSSGGASRTDHTLM